VQVDDADKSTRKKEKKTRNRQDPHSDQAASAPELPPPESSGAASPAHNGPDGEDAPPIQASKPKKERKPRTKVKDPNRKSKQAGPEQDPLPESSAPSGRNVPEGVPDAAAVQISHPEGRPGAVPGGAEGQGDSQVAVSHRSKPDKASRDDRRRGRDLMNRNPSQRNPSRQGGDSSDYRIDPSQHGRGVPADDLAVVPPQGMDRGRADPRGGAGELDGASAGFQEEPPQPPGFGAAPPRGLRPGSAKNRKNKKGRGASTVVSLSAGPPADSWDGGTHAPDEPAGWVHTDAPPGFEVVGGRGRRRQGGAHAGEGLVEVRSGGANGGDEGDMDPVRRMFGQGFSGTSAQIGQVSGVDGAELLNQTNDRPRSSKKGPPRIRNAVGDTAQLTAANLGMVPGGSRSVSMLEGDDIERGWEGSRDLQQPPRTGGRDARGPRRDTRVDSEGCSQGVQGTAEGGGVDGERKAERHGRGSRGARGGAGLAKERDSKSRGRGARNVRRGAGVYGENAQLRGDADMGDWSRGEGESSSWNDAGVGKRGKKGQKRNPRTATWKGTAGRHPICDHAEECSAAVIV
jgi:hypothetical protein